MAKTWITIKPVCSLVLAILLLSWFSHAALADESLHPCQLNSSDAVPGTVNILILKPVSDTGSRYRSGILDACKFFLNKYPSYQGKINLLEDSYFNEQDGVSKLKSLFQSVAKPSPDVPPISAVFGPTESGVFVKGIEVISADAKHGIPVISPLVVARAGNSPDGWFFRLNVDVEDRTEVIYEFLNRKNFNTIAVVHADNTLGQRSEQAFRALLTDTQENNYFPYSYGSNKDEMRTALLEILEKRPAAIGVFGQSSEIDHLVKKIKGMDDGWSTYSPLIFTNIDAGPLQKDDLHYVSLLNPTPEDASPKPWKDDADSLKKDDQYAGDERNRGEVYALSYDTALLTLQLMQENNLMADTPDLAIKLRRAMINVLDGPAEPYIEGSLIKMRFDNFRNQTSPVVVSYQGGRPEKMDADNIKGFVWVSKCQQWLSNLIRSHGYLPFWNIFLVMVAGLLINVIDLTKLYGVPLAYMWRREFASLVALNIVIAEVVYLFMTFSGLLDWNDTWGAILAVTSYTLLLKSKILASDKAQAFGLADVYDRIVRKKHHDIMIARLQNEGKTIINYIAYANTLVYLQKVLYEIYKFTEGDNAEDTKKELEQELSSIKDLIEKRKVLAQKIREKLNWEGLQQKRLVPYDVKENEVETKLFDPLVIASIGAEYCYKKQDKDQKYQQHELEKMVRDGFKQIRDSAKRKEKEKAFDDELKSDLTRQALLETTLLWLFIDKGFDTDLLVHDGFLPHNFDQALNRPRENHRQHFREVVNMAVGLRNPTSAVDLFGAQRPAQLENISEGGAQMSLLSSHAGDLSEDMEIEVVEEQQNRAFAAVIVYSRQENQIRSIGIKWKEPFKVAAIGMLPQPA